MSFDIQIATEVDNCFMIRPQQSHLLLAKKTLLYIKDIQGYKILHRNNNETILSRYVDPNWVENIEQA